MNNLPVSVTALTPVRAEPRDDAEQVTQALAGEPLWVEEERDGWLRVRTAYGYPGWVQAAGGADVLAAARAYLGTRYEWGGMTTAGIDCSGLVHMAFRRLGILVPRDSWQQETAGEPVAGNDVGPGDVRCYDRHVAFDAGGGKIVHATGRAGVRAVVEEPEPPQLRAALRTCRRFSPAFGAAHAHSI